MVPRVVATAVKAGCGWVLGVGDSKRSGAHTRESALGKATEGRVAGGSGPWDAGIDLLVHPRP